MSWRAKMRQNPKKRKNRKKAKTASKHCKPHSPFKTCVLIKFEVSYFLINIAVAVAVHLNQQKHMFCFQKHTRTHTRTHHVSDNNCPLISSHQVDGFIQWIGCCCKSNEFAIYISSVDDSDSDSDNKRCYCNDYHVCWTCWESLSNSFYRFQHELRELRPTWTYIGTNLTLSHFYHFPHSFGCVSFLHSHCFHPLHTIFSQSLIFRIRRSQLSNGDKLQ